MKLYYHTDPGHGWVQAPRRLVNDLGIANKISAYSYQLQNSVYLEEDCDAPLLVNALKARGVTPTFHNVSLNRESNIRHYERYRPAPSPIEG